MNRKFIAFVVFLWIGIPVVFSQKGTIYGVVSDQVSGDEIPYASVAVVKNNQATVYGTVSDDAGAFKVDNLPFGAYSVLVSFIGYKTDTIKNITISKENVKVNIGNIPLLLTSVSLEGVEVRGMSQTATTKIDRKTYRASDFETAKGGTAVDVLDKLPSVSVDGEGTVSVRGTSDFLVYINGKPTQSNASDLLSQLPANQIKNVEIITVPGARYDAQGKGGIINITTQKGALDGLSVVANGMLGGTPWTNDDDVYSHQKLDNNRYNAGVSITYNKEKLSLTGAFQMQSRNNNGVGIIDPYIYQDPENSVSGYPGMFYVLDGEGSRPKWYTNIVGSAGVSYRFNEKSEVEATYQYAERTSGRTANYVYDAYFSAQPDGEPFDGTLQKIYNPNDIHRDGWFSNFSLDFRQKVSSQQRWSSSLIYETSDLDQTIDNKEFAYDGERYYFNDTPEFHSFQRDKTPLKAYRFVFDYQRDFDNGSALELGIQPQWVRLDGEFTYDTLIRNNYWGDQSIESFDNNIDLQRDVYAAYADFRGTREKLEYAIGLRMEYMNQRMTVASTEYFEYVYAYFDEVGDGRNFDQSDFKQRKFDWFPSLHLNYTLDALNSVSLAASRRISRPPAKDMAPFLYRRHQEIYEMGDPLLEPESVLNAELNYSRRFGTNNITFTGFYRGVDHAIYRVNRVAYDMGNSGGVLLRSYTNAGNQVALGAEMGMNLNFFSKVKLFAGGSLYDFRVIADDELLGESRDSRSTNWGIKSNATWMITDPVKLTLDYSYASGTVTPQGENLEFQSLNAALNYQPEKLAGWTFTAKMLDILGSNQTGGYTAAYEGEQVLLRRDYVYDYEGQIIELAVAYAFNSKKQKARKKLIGDAYF